MRATDRGRDMEPMALAHETSGRAPSVISLIIQDVGCRHCVTRIRNALLSVPGVERADMSPNLPVAIVSFDPGRTDEEALIHAVAAASQGTDHEYRASKLSWSVPR